MILPVTGLAQDSTAATGITGTVTDNSGGSIPGAQIVIKGTSGETKPQITTVTGEFTVLGLAAGVYEVVITAPNFADYHRSGVSVSTSSLTRVDAILSPAAAAGASVNVQESGAGAVETDTSQLSGTLTAHEVVSQPLNGRNFTQLIALTPGVSNQTSQDEAKVGVVGSVKYSVNGGRVEYNTFDVDGSDVLNAGINGSSSTLVVYPSLDAIQEVRVLTSNYGAMYGRTASGTVLVTTKGGTDQFHGNAYYFGRNEFFNARNFFDETQGAPLYRRHDLGATIGGPVPIPGRPKADKKTFFFFSEEYRWEKSPQQYNQAVPSLAERSGDFSDVCPALGTSSYPYFKRASYPDCPAVVRPVFSPKDQVFPFNQLPALDRNAVAILNTGIIPAPNSSSGCDSSIGSCYDQTVSPLTTWREELFRIDHNINDTTRATVRYIHDAWDTTVPTPQWGFLQNSFPTVENAFTGPGVSVIARLTKTFSPTLVNDAVFSYVNSTIMLTDQPGPGAQIQRPAILDAPCAVEDPTGPIHAVQCPVGYLFNNGFGGKIPGIVVGGSNQAYGGAGFTVDSSYMPWHHTNPVLTFGDSVSKVLGNHNIQFGGQFITYHRVQNNGPIGAATGDTQGILSFSNEGSVNTTGNAFADFLDHYGGSTQGRVKSFTQDSAQLTYSQRYQIFEPYIQDDWRLKRRLTVNLGLRLSLFGTYRETNHNVYNWERSAYDAALADQAYVSPQFGFLLNNPDGLKDSIDQIALDTNNLDPRITNGLVHCGVNGVPSSCMKGHLFNPAPRIGFAWDPKGDGKSSLRVGYGIFFEHGTGNEANTGSLEASAPLVLNMTQTYVTGWGCIGGANSATDLCNTPTSPAFPLNVTSIPTKAVWPYVQQWSLSYQRELPSHSVATFAFVGSKGTHLTAERQLNQLIPVSAADNPFPAHVPLIPLIPAINGIRAGDCGNYDTVTGKSLPTAPGFALNSGPVIYPGNPAFVNMEAACYNNVPGGDTPYDPNSLRQFAPGFGQVISLENSANSSYRAFQATLRRTEGRLTLGASYTLSRSMDDSSDRSDANFVNSYDLRSNWARSDFNQRNLLNFNYVYALPLDRLRAHPSNFWRNVLDSWELSGITVYQSGTPFSVINIGGSSGVSVQDNAGVANGIGAGSYPDLVSNPNYAPPAAGNNGRSFGPLLLNPGAFAAPRGLTFGDAGRNVLTNPRRTNFDTALLKNVKWGETRTLELRVEAFNIFNHTEFRIYDPNLGNKGNNTVSCYGGPASGYSAAGGDGTDCLTGSAFLHPVNAHRPRTIQYGIKFGF